MSDDGHLNAELPMLTLLQRGARWFSDELVKRLDAAGVAPITTAHTTVLSHLDLDTTLSVAELARRADVTRQTMHRAVMTLVDEGLLTSSPGPGFPRTTLIGLTDAGYRRRAVALGILRDLEADLGSRLGNDGLAELRDGLTRAWPR